MSERAFLPSGKASVWFIGEWRRKGGLRGLQTAAVYVSNGYATAPLRGLWRQAFPTRQPLPLGPIANADGTLTQAMRDVLA